MLKQRICLDGDRTRLCLNNWLRGVGNMHIQPKRKALMRIYHLFSIAVY